MNIVASRSGSEEGRECRQNITPTKTHRNWEQGRSVPVHLEDTKSTGSLHNTSSKYWQYSTSITQSDSQLKLTLSFNRENCPSTWFGAQMKNTIPTLPHTTQSSSAQFNWGWKDPSIPWGRPGKAATSRESGRADGSGSQPLPHPDAPVERCPIEIWC